MESGEGRERAGGGANVQRFRGGLVLKAHRLLHHSTGLAPRLDRPRAKQVVESGEGREGAGGGGESSLLTTYWSESTLSS